MKILGIETSCDETAISIIDATGDFGADFHFKILGDKLLSQATLHAEYGGVFPSLAKREHAKALIPLFAQVLEEAGMSEPASTPPVPKELVDELRALLEREPELFAQLTLFLATHEKPAIDAIAVTAGPGLEPALWVGINLARALARAWNLPIVSANHMEGHIIISSIENDHLGDFRLPALALLISGGHTEFVVSREWMRYENIGQTRDDAVGEAFDKTARLLGLPYPGGPALSQLAAEHRASGASDTTNFPRPMINSDDLDFSFSGLKTAVRIYLEKNPDTEKSAIARAFEDAVTDVIVAKTRKALEATLAKTLIIGGGVSANTHIREALAKLIASEFPDVSLLLPPREHATDNALMIALAGYFHALHGDFIDPTHLRADGTRGL